MTRRLRAIKDWETLAQEANWCANTLAKNCGVSLRTLERHFLLQFGIGPHEWLERDRQKRARELLLDGSTVKETAAILAYKNQHHFARAFKQHHGHPPSQHILLISQRFVNPRLRA